MAALTSKSTAAAPSATSNSSESSTLPSRSCKRPLITAVEGLASVVMVVRPPSENSDPVVVEFVPPLDLSSPPLMR